MDFVYSWEAMNSQSVDSEVCMCTSRISKIVFPFAFALAFSLLLFCFLLASPWIQIWALQYRRDMETSKVP